MYPDVMMERAQQALQKAIHKYMSDRNITLIELGFKEKNGQIQTDESDRRPALN